MEPFVKRRIQLFRQTSLLLTDCLAPLSIEEHYLLWDVPGLKEYLTARTIPRETALMSVFPGGAHALCISGCRGVGKTAFLRLASRASLYTACGGRFSLAVLACGELVDTAQQSHAELIFRHKTANSNYLKHERAVVRVKNMRARQDVVNQLTRRIPQYSLRGKDDLGCDAPLLTSPCRYSALAVDDVQYASESQLGELLRRSAAAYKRVLLLACPDNMFAHNSDENALQDEPPPADLKNKPTPANLTNEPVQKARNYHLKPIARRYSYAASNPIILTSRAREHNAWPATQSPVSSAAFPDHSYPESESEPLTAVEAQRTLICDKRRHQRHPAEVWIDLCASGASDHVLQQQRQYLRLVCSELEIKAGDDEFSRADHPSLLDLRASLLKIHFWRESLACQRNCPRTFAKATPMDEISLFDVKALNTAIPEDLLEAQWYYDYFRRQALDYTAEFAAGVQASSQEAYLYTDSTARHADAHQ